MVSLLCHLICSSQSLALTSLKTRRLDAVPVQPFWAGLFHRRITHPDAGRDWGQEEKGTTEDEMAGWLH